jgi:hypothetical protein
MVLNTFTISADGNIKSDTKVKVTHSYTCACGANNTLNTEWDKNLVLDSSLTFKGITCPSCGVEVNLPKASYSEIEGILVAN